MASLFDHEKLNVYQQAIRFITWCNPLFEATARLSAVHSQLDRASTSIPLNIAEGNGKFTSADRCKFFDIARGSALECLDVLVAKAKTSPEEALKGKRQLVKIVAMIVGLIKSNSSTRTFEEPPESVEAGQD